MIILFSETDDESTTRVMKWLRKICDFEIIRINENEKNFKFDLRISTSNKNTVKITLNEKVISFCDIKSIWFRKSHFNLSNQEKPIDSISIPKNIKKDIEHFLYNENNILKDALWYFLMKKKNLGNPLKQSLNKLVVLDLAAKNGLTIPESFIKFNKPQELPKQRLIIKAISEAPFWSFDNYVLNYKTYLLNKSKLNKTFFPSLFQVYIDKKFEIRSFFLRGKFYSMAIFSQESKNTEIDYRNYDIENPNRYIPYVLPIDIEKKLKKLLVELNLDTGSIDLIYTKSNTFVFLEVNPVGQYDMVSAPCNYYLDKKIANLLVE